MDLKLDVAATDCPSADRCHIGRNARGEAPLVTAALGLIQTDIIMKPLAFQVLPVSTRFTNYLSALPGAPLFPVPSRTRIAR